MELIDKATLDAAEAVLARHGMETKVLGVMLHNAPARFVRADRVAASLFDGGGWWWRVCNECGEVMGRDGTWVYEPLPSARDTKFFDRCRFRDFGEAVAVFVANRSRLVGA